MRRSTIIYALAIAGAAGAFAAHAKADGPRPDFGLFVAQQLREHSEELFGFRHPLSHSALGPYDGTDNTNAIVVAEGLSVSLVSSSVASAADQIAFWPNDDRPTHVFVCDEETSNPAVQRVDLSRPAGSNATTIVIGLSSCDPVRRTPWGTIIVAEENGSDGGLYEILDPLSITTPITVISRATGQTSDPNHLVKRQAVGALSFEGIATRRDGTTIYGDELAPSNGNAGGAMFKFLPQIPYNGTGTPAITDPALSPLASGSIYGLRVAAAKGSTNYGQGAEVGNGDWVKVTTAPDVNGNINLRTAATALKLTGWYRPEDMDIDPIALENGVFRACWANTGRQDFGGGSAVEGSAVHGEVMCIVEMPNATAATGFTPNVTRFVVGSLEAAMFDNVAFQPYTGNLVVLEDGPTTITTASGAIEPRGNDLWICLPDGADDDTLTDGCVRFASIKDTSAEPTGFIFYGSGESALVNIQHRKVNDDAGNTNHGALVKISGFRVHGHGHDN